MSVEVRCDRCGRSPIVVWGEVSYSPGGGRHGADVFHFCHECVDDLRTFVMGNVPAIPGESNVIFAGHGWMVRQDYLKQADRV